MGLIVADAGEHAWVYAAYKELSLADRRGNVFADTPCDLFQVDQTTKVTTYTDETRGVIVEQLTTDHEGNIGIWVLPGVYRLRINFLNPPGATDWVQIEVPINPKELNIVRPDYDTGSAPSGYDALVTTVGTHSTQILSLQGLVVANTAALVDKLDKADTAHYVTSVNGSTGAVTVDSTGVVVGPATSTQQGTIRLAGDLAGTADGPQVPGLATKASAADLTAHVGNVTDAHGIYRTATLPDGTTQTDWTPSQKVFINAAGNMWIQKGSTIDPGGGIPDPTLSEQVAIAEAHYEKAYVAANGAAVSGGTTTSLACAKALRNAVLDRDKTKFDLILSFLENNMRRDKSGSGQTTFLRGYASAASSAGVVSSYTLDMGAEVMIAFDLVRAWNLWNDTKYQDIGSWKAKLIVDMSILDENRRYLPHDETTSPAGYIKIRLSDLDFEAFRALLVFTSDAKFNSLVQGTYDLWQKATASSGGLPSSVGLPPDWVAYNTSSHGVSAITSGTNGWTITQSTDYNSDLADAVLFLLAENAKYADTRSTALLTALKTFFANRWATDGVIIDTYTHVDGTAVGSTESAQRYLVAYLVLTFNEVGNAAAASILSTKIQAMATDSNGKYFPNQIQGVTAAASRDAQAELGLLNAMRAGIYQDMTLVGSNPGAGTTNPGGGGGGGTPPGGTFKLYTDPNSQLMGYANSLSAGVKKTRVTWVASLPQALWSGINWDPDPSTSGTKTYIDAAVAAGAVPLLLSYSIPLRDFGQFSSGGAANLAQYQDWITKFATAVGNNKAAIVYEPDSLSQLENLPTDDARTGRIAAMTWGLAYLRQHCPNAWLYIDAGHPNWHDAATMVTRIKSIHGEIANGCALNVSNFETTAACITYGNDIASGMNAGAGWGYTIDIGRNGNPAPLVQFGTGDDWSNPPNRRIGGVPQWGGFTATPLLHGTAIWKRLGESDGSARGAPSAGSLYPQSVYNDSVGDNVDANSIGASSGYAQRPPTPGVASPG